MTVINDYSKVSFTDLADRTPTEYATPSILPIRSSGTQAPIFCIHPVVGHATCYTALAEHIDSAHPVFGVQDSATDVRPASLTELAARYAQDILDAAPRGPIHLLGSAFGGVLAHAVAVELQSRGTAVDSLTLLESDPVGHDVAADPDDLLAGMGEDIDRSHVEELLAAATHNETLAARHFPGVFVGNVLAISTVGSDAVSAWHPFVSGTVSKYLVPDASAHEIVGTLVNSYL